MNNLSNESNRLTPSEAIEFFWGYISWKEECTVKDGVIFTSCSVLVPCHYTELDARLADVLQLGREHDRRAGLILHGDTKHHEVSSREIERCWWTIHRTPGLHHYWLGAHNCLESGRLTLYAIDGVDLNSFFTGIAGGVNQKQ